MSKAFGKVVTVRRLPFLLRAGLALTLVCFFGGASTSAFAVEAGPSRQVGPEAQRSRVQRSEHRASSSIMKPGWTADAEAARLGGRLGRRLGLINGRVARALQHAAEKLADHPGVDAHRP